MCYNGYMGSQKGQRKYHMIRSGGVNISEHRRVAYEAGWDIEGKVVHHKDNDPLNNCLDNLEAMTYQQHRHHHTNLPDGTLSTGDYINMPCCVCGTERMIKVAHLRMPRHTGACRKCAPSLLRR